MEFIEYNIIKDFYGDRTAKRSGVPLINHIDEGLVILDKINASDISKSAYCLHPIVQSDEALFSNWETLQNIDNKVIIALMEYRSVANEYLSTRQISKLSDIRLSPLKDVNDMLIADKIQNRKDFILHHVDTHVRRVELSVYFNNWLTRLDISDSFYLECVNAITNKIISDNQ